MDLDESVVYSMSKKVCDKVSLTWGSEPKKSKKKARKAEKNRAKLEAKAEKQAKKNRKELEEVLVDYRVPEKLTDDERKFYKKIGKIIPGQNYLELFTDDVIHDLKLIMKATFKDKEGKAISSNQNKFLVIKDELEHLGFKDAGLGTNIGVLRHKKYPGVVFKIALDNLGIDDNINDQWLSRVNSDMYARFICRHPSGIVSVQEAYATILTKDRMGDFIGQAYDMLTRLERDYVIADMSPVNYKNYAVSRDGRLVIIDGSDLIPIPPGKDLLRCKKIAGFKNGKRKFCGAKLHYTADYNRLVCPVCGRVFVPSELRPKVEITEEARLMLVNTGLSKKEMKDLCKYTDELIAESGFTVPEREKEEEPKIESKKKTKGISSIDDLDLPDYMKDMIKNHPEEAAKKLEGAKDLMKLLGIKKKDKVEEDPFDHSEDADEDDEDEDFVMEELPNGEPPEENYEPDEEDDDEDESDEDDDLDPSELKWPKSMQEFMDEESEELTNDQHRITPDKDALNTSVDVDVKVVNKVADVESIDESYTDQDEAFSVAQSSTSIGEGDTTGVTVYNRSDEKASLEVEYSEDPCALNVFIKGDVVKAFSENGPSIFVAFDENPEDWKEVITPEMLGKMVAEAIKLRF